jgi:sugar lactone lactonase YvrE
MKKGDAMCFRAVAAIVLALAVGLAAGPAQASVPIHTVLAFNPAAGEFPEGIAIDKRGNLYTSLIEPVGEVRVLRPGGEQQVVAHFPVSGFGPLGLAADAAGALYVAVASFDPATEGVYRIHPDGTSTRLPGTGSILFPNGIALDKRGAIYATDSISGAVWRIPPGGSAELWAQSPLLEGNGSAGLGFPIGANGIAFRPGQVIVANTEGGSLVRIPVEPNGSAGTPAVIAQGPDLFGADGVALGVLGNVYVAVNTQSMLLRVSPGGATTTLATAADGLENPASLAFGTGMGQRRTLFLTNFAIFSATPHPAVLAAAVGEPGLPLP